MIKKETRQKESENTVSANETGYRLDARKLAVSTMEKEICSEYGIHDGDLLSSFIRLPT